MQTSSHRRQPIHVVYGGAHLFRADTASRLGAAALRALDEYAPDASTLASVLEICTPRNWSRATRPSMRSSWKAWTLHRSDCSI